MVSGDDEARSIGTVRREDASLDCAGHARPSGAAIESSNGAEVSSPDEHRLVQARALAALVKQLARKAAAEEMAVADAFRRAIQTAPMITDELTPTGRNHCWRITVVADMLDISVSSVRRLIRDGKLAAVYIGTSLRVPEQGLEALLKAGARRSRSRGKK